MKSKMKAKQWWIFVVMICFVSFSALSASGCAGKTTTSSVTTTTDGASGSSSTVTTQNVETSAHPRGIIGGVFYTVGQVLIWPFKVIGSLF